MLLRGEQRGEVLLDRRMQPPTPGVAAPPACGASEATLGAGQGVREH